MNQAKSPLTDDQIEDEGKSGSGDFGKPQLKPNLEALFAHPGEMSDSSVNITDQQNSSKTETSFGSWAYHESSLTLFHKNLRKKLNLEQLNAPSKILKIVVALSTTTEDSGKWEIDNLVKALDSAVQKKFNKSLYQIANLSNDQAHLDWQKGTFVTQDQAKHSAGI